MASVKLKIVATVKNLQSWAITVNQKLLPFNFEKQDIELDTDRTVQYIHYSILGKKGGTLRVKVTDPTGEKVIFDNKDSIFKIPSPRKGNRYTDDGTVAFILKEEGQ